MNQLPFEKTSENIPSTPSLSHLNASGEAQMVDVSGKPPTVREAVAQARVKMQPDIQAAIVAGHLPKGDVLATVRLAGIMAAKQTANLIPLCHPLPLHQVEIQIEPEPSGFRIVARAKTVAETGVEMEALTAATIAALTMYDMAKGLDKAIEIAEIHLLRKTGGKSGDWVRE